MKKFILKQILTVSLLSLPAALISCTPEEHQAHADFVHQIIKNTTDFAHFSIQWTADFFDTNNHRSFATFTNELTQATRKFNELVIKPLEAQIGSLRNSKYYPALTVVKKIACQLHDQAHDVCGILNKNINNRNATFVGLALQKTEKYTSTNTINQLECDFRKAVHELRKVDQNTAIFTDQMGNDVIRSRKAQHKMSMGTQLKALHHRVKCIE